jgi:hypothetical protein
MLLHVHFDLSMFHPQSGRDTMGDFKVGVNTGVECTVCPVNTDTNTNFEITQCVPSETQIYSVTKPSACLWCRLLESSD